MSPGVTTILLIAATAVELNDRATGCAAELPESPAVVITVDYPRRSVRGDTLQALIQDRVAIPAVEPAFAAVFGVELTDRPPIRINRAALNRDVDGTCAESARHLNAVPGCLRRL